MTHSILCVLYICRRSVKTGSSTCVYVPGRRCWNLGKSMHLPSAKHDNGTVTTVSAKGETRKKKKKKKQYNCKIASTESSETCLRSEGVNQELQNQRSSYKFLLMYEPVDIWRRFARKSRCQSWQVVAWISPSLIVCCTNSFSPG